MMLRESPPMSKKLSLRPMGWTLSIRLQMDASTFSGQRRLKLVGQGGYGVLQRIGKLFFIQLAAEVEREFVKYHEIGGDHVGREVTGERRDDLGS